MNKSLCILLLVVLVGVAHIDAKKSKKSKVLNVLSHGKAAAGLLFSESGYGFADNIVIGTKVSDLKFVGTVRGFFATFPVDKIKDPKADIFSQIGPAILTLPQGKIAYTCERFGVRATAYAVITGGTGKFAGASGEIEIFPVVDDNTVYQLKFTFDKPM